MKSDQCSPSLDLAKHSSSSNLAQKKFEVHASLIIQVYSPLFANAYISVTQCNHTKFYFGHAHHTKLVISKQHPLILNLHPILLRGEWCAPRLLQAQNNFRHILWRVAS